MDKSATVEAVRRLSLRGESWPLTCTPNLSTS